MINFSSTTIKIFQRNTINDDKICLNLKLIKASIPLKTFDGKYKCMTISLCLNIIEMSFRA